MSIKIENKLQALQQKRKNKGATILEIIIFMGLAAFVALMVMQGSTQATDNQKAGAEVQNLNTLKTGIRQMFGTQRLYTGLQNEAITSSSNFPEQMRVDGDLSMIASSWATNGVTVAPAELNSVANSGFLITYKSVPKEACVDIISRTYRHFIAVNVGDTVAEDAGITNVTDIRAACTGATNSISFLDR